MEDGVANGHNDPEWHYVVVGGNTNIVSVETTEDDKIGQFGRIHANTEKVLSLVAFYYDAVETGSVTSGSSRYIIWCIVARTDRNCRGKCHR